MSERYYHGATSRSSNEKKDRNKYLIKDTFNTFYLQLYGIGQVVKDLPDSDRKPATATWVSQTAQVITVVCVRRKEGNVLFNDNLNTFYLHLYDVGPGKGPFRMREIKPAAAIKWAFLSDHQQRILLYVPSHRQDRTYYIFCFIVALDGMRNSSMGPMTE